MFSLSGSGGFDNAMKFLKRVSKGEAYRSLDKYAQQGVVALASATPKDSGVTANSWGYEVERTSTGYKINWTNKNVNQEVNIAIILQYGHGTGTGGYVSGRDYINPAIQPVFDKIAQEAWKEVTGG